MKSLSYSTFFLLLFSLALSCKKDQNPDPGEKLFTDPTHLPLPPQGCKIVKISYKEPSAGRTKEQIWEPETITLEDGKNVNVSIVYKGVYTYDSNSRIKTFKEYDIENYVNSCRYVYTTDYAICIKEDIIKGIGQSVRVDTIQLNEKGLRTRFKGLGKSYYIYNDQDQLVDDDQKCPGASHTYENGNLVQRILYQYCDQLGNGQWHFYDRQINHYFYHPTRPDLPTLFQMDGNSNRNLPVKELWETQHSEYPRGYVYQKIYTYLYDQHGQVRRRIVHGKSLVPGWLIEDNLHGVGVYDYEYDCP
ncbi:hypothetical protein [Larkinella soli]|uniref:hypothetical protein n=1 Tax=Larkinella soli TaxID=1770527 RepID=UPI000FFB55D7|nr:hypothetical protein [Larkinella soli]